MLDSKFYLLIHATGAMSQIAASHFSKDSGESSNTVPVLPAVISRLTLGGEPAMVLGCPHVFP